MTRKHWHAAPATIILLAGLITMTALAGLSARATLAAGPTCAVHVRRCAVRNAPESAMTTGSTPGFDVVSATGGYVGGVVVSANYAFFAEGAGLTILDISNALLPVQVARLVLPVIARDVQVAGGLAYITTSKGLYVIDVSHPVTPTVVSSYVTPGDAIVVRVVGARAYITVGGVYDPGSGNYVGKGLQIIDVSAAAHPVLLGSYLTSDFPGDVQIVGNLAYLIHGDGYNDGVQILNISDPAHIAPQGNYAMPGKDALALDVVSGKAYIGYMNTSTFDGGLQIINVSTPSNPTLLGSYATVGPTWDVQITGNVAFLAAHTQLVALDIGTPSKPSPISTYKLSGVAEAVYDGLQVVNGLAYLPTEGFTHDQIVGIQIVDVHTPAAPAARGAYRTLWSVGSSSNPNSIKLAGNIGYALNNGEQVRAFDNTNPARPTFMNTSAPTTTNDLDIVGNHLYNAAGKNGLQVFDIGNPSAPILLGSYTEPDISFDRVHVAGNRAYVAANYQLKIIDISNPSNLVLLGQYHSGGYPLSIEVVGTLVYLTGESGLAIFDASDPSHIIPAGGYHPNTATNAVEVVGQRAYLAANGYYETNLGLVKQGLYIADISDPAHPQELGRYVTPGAALAVRIAGDRAYVAGLVDGLVAEEIWIIDIGDPANPTLLATYDLPSQAGSMVIAGDLMYVGDGDAGLLVLRFQDSIPQSGVVGADGGALDFGGTLALTFPPGAATSLVTVTYSLLMQPTHELPGDQHALRGFTLEAHDSDGNLIMHFTKPYTLVISYTDAQLAALGIDEADLNLAFWNGSAWVNVLPCAGCGVDTVNNRLTAVLDHFTEFALLSGVPTAGDGKIRLYLPMVRR